MQTGNYFCTWLSQYKTLPTFEAGCNVTNVRDRMCEDFLWGERGILQAIDERVRGDIIVLLDDGWDVPFSTSSSKEELCKFGSLVPDSDRFPSAKGTAVERLRTISEKVKSLGFRGLGLWICCNLIEENQNGEKKLLDLEKARELWERNARYSSEAGVLYWKVDWGYHDRDVDYRRMMTESVRKYAPDLEIEHSLMQSCFNSETAEHYKWAIPHVLSVSDYLRSYDCVEELMYPLTISRVEEILRAESVQQYDCKGIINIEDLPTLGASLGCSLGIMRHKKGYWNEVCLDRADVACRSNEVCRALIWHRYAPPFGCRDTESYISDTNLTDEWLFDIHPLDWTYKIVGGKKLSASAPAIISRGTPLPCVGDNNSLQETPYIISSKNPKTGAFSIATLPRTQCDRLFYEPRADVSAYVGESDVTIGVFGAYKSLSLRFDGDMSGVRVYGADLLAFADCEISHSKMTDITDKVKIVGDTIVFDGELIEKVGKALQSAGDRSSAGMVVSCVRRTQL